MTLSSTATLEQDPALERLLKLDALPSSFAELVSCLRGKHPADTLCALERLPSRDDTVGQRVAGLIREARWRAPHGDLPQGEGLALPHPLDSEWRFTEQTADMLVSAAAATTRQGDPVLLMGVPSVVLAALRSTYDRQFLVVGESNVITRGLGSLTGQDNRFQSEAPQASQAAAAILDPPWYLDQFQGMLSQASSYCRLGAHLWVSAPPEGVRPGIAEDIADIHRVAEDSGLEFCSEQQGGLVYRTPFFEVNALRAAGVSAWLPEWRRGDLFQYVKCESGVIYGKSVSVPGFEVTLAGVRLRLLSDSMSHGTVWTSICDAEVFPSVSARAEGRSAANLWTSGNRAFAVDPALGIRALAAIAVERGLWANNPDFGFSPSDGEAPIDTIHWLIQKLTELADREFAEATSILGSAAWDRSVNDARFLNGSWNAFQLSHRGTNG